MGTIVSRPEIVPSLTNIGVGQDIPVEANTDRERYETDVVTFPSYWPNADDSETFPNSDETDDDVDNVPSCGKSMVPELKDLIGKKHRAIRGNPGRLELLYPDCIFVSTNDLVTPKK